MLVLLFMLLFNISSYHVLPQILGSHGVEGNSVKGSNNAHGQIANSAEVKDETLVNVVKVETQDAPKVITKENTKKNDSKVAVDDKTHILSSEIIKKSEKDSSIISVIPKGSNLGIVESGALRRGFYVFLAFSALTVLYFIYRSYRLRRGSQPTSIVRKYGVTARRSDIEMRPLELDDEDDETIFEVGQKNIS